MNRKEFEHLRDMEGKVIRGDISFARKQATQPMLVAEKILIENPAGVPLAMNINFNPETGAKTLNVYSPAEGGPICRLDVDGKVHRPAGRSHKHSVQDEHSVRRHLREGVVDRSELSGKRVREVFEVFCREARIAHEGAFQPPDEEG